jgi:putative ABC transport system ATP-binding protein
MAGWCQLKASHRSEEKRVSEPRPLNRSHIPAECQDEPLIEMVDIVKTFRTGAGEFQALRGVTVCFQRGEFVGVVGKSGSGKSTLVNMLAGIDHPTSGRVRVGQTLIHQLNESQMSVWRGRNLGIVFQFFQLLPMLTLLENVLLPMDFANLIPPAERQARAWQLLDMVGLADFSEQLPAAVAGGQQQCAAIARALANDPPIIIADEPTGNLDARTAETVFDIFLGLARTGKTIIMVTHDDQLASRTARRLEIVDGVLSDPALPQPAALAQVGNGRHSTSGNGHPPRRSRLT